MKTFEEIVEETKLDEDNYDMEKMEDIYNILKDFSFSKESDIILVYNKIITLFWCERFNNKETTIINKILSYLHILVDINNNFDDIALQINFYKYNKISLEIYNEILSYKNKVYTNLNFELYIILWNKFLNYKDRPIIERLKEYYILNDENSYHEINKKIINEYMIINNLKTLNHSYKIDNHITLFFLLITDKL